MANNFSADPEQEEGIDDEFSDADADYDVALSPGPSADPASDVEKYISAKVRARYDVFSYQHAAAILANSFPKELEEIQQALLNFSITVREIAAPGGNESEMPKKFGRTLRPAGWAETRIQGDLHVRLHEYDEAYLANGKTKKTKRPEGEPKKIENFIDGHKIDYVKGRVAFDLEWNSKDQTFDRDLYALRAFHDCGLVSVGVLVTRSASMNPLFDVIQQVNKKGDPEFLTGKKAGQIKTVKSKYGASTTWMGKLLYRLDAGRHGGCPVLVFGITPKLVEDCPILP